MNREETLLQIELVEHIESHQAPGAAFWHTPNGGLRSKAEAVRFKLMGVKAGVPDISAYNKTGNMCFVELKARKGRLSKAQDDFAQSCAHARIPYLATKHLGEAIAFLKQNQIIN